MIKSVKAQEKISNLFEPCAVEYDSYKNLKKKVTILKIDMEDKT
jgi:hypothetical protein